MRSSIKVRRIINGATSRIGTMAIQVVIGRVEDLAVHGRLASHYETRFAEDGAQLRVIGILQRRSLASTVAKLTDSGWFFDVVIVGRTSP